MAYCTRHGDLSVAAVYIIRAHLIRMSVPIIGWIINNTMQGSEEMIIAISIVIATVYLTNGKGKSFY